jgi:hypothetical protein
MLPIASVTIFQSLLTTLDLFVFSHHNIARLAAPLIS